MPRSATGTIEVATLGDGTLVFRLRFRAYGRREREVLHERRDCACGCGGGWTERTARNELENVLAKVRAGVWRKREVHPAAEHSHGRAPTFHEYASEWAARWKAGEFGNPPDDATIADYLAWRLPKLLLPTRIDGRALARIPVDDDHLTRRTCGAFKAALIAQRDELRAAIEAGADLRDRKGRRVRPLSNRSVQMACRLLAQILEQAVADGLLLANPARGSHMKVAVPKPLRTFLEMDELVDLIGAAARSEDSETTRGVRALAAEGLLPREIATRVGINHTTVYYHLRKPLPTPDLEGRSFVTGLSHGGLRVSEALALRWRDVRLHGDPRLGVVDSKTETGIREVDLTPRMRDELRVWRADQATRGKDVGPDAFVWAQPNGEARSTTWARKLLARAVALANGRREARGLAPLPEQVTPHSLRRTYISILLLASKGDIEYVMNQVGHADAETTMRIYSQLLKRKKREHGTAFDALVAQAHAELYGPEMPADPADWATDWATGVQEGA